jgi:trehalose 6-phosphate synthase
VAVPSRERVPAYQKLRAEVEAIVASVNARHGTTSWKPVEYLYAPVNEVELAALYRSADVMLVTALRDGMNLVAKEFVSSRTDDMGVLLLSKFAGAAEELRAALLVDPSDVEALASAYVSALAMSPAEQRARMRRLKASVWAHDVRRWASECLHELDAGP